MRERPTDVVCCPARMSVLQKTHLVNAGEDIVHLWILDIYPICEMSSPSDNLSATLARLFCWTTTGVPQGL